MFLLLFQVIILFFILFLIYLISWFLPTDSPWSPWWATSPKVARKLCKLVNLNKNDVFYELGSGTGTTCIIATKDFKAKAIGIESSKSRVWWSNLKAKRSGISEKVNFIQTDFFKYDISPATVVYFYLVPRVVEKLKNKLLKELKPGTLVVSYIYEVDYLPLFKEDSKTQLYVYKIPSRNK